MKVLYARCAGLDVHKDSVVACMRTTRGNEAEYEVRTFGTTTRGLLELSEWLTERGCEHVLMEATGVYWKPVWHVLEPMFDLTLANAAHVKNVPGRKTDVNDATWLSDLIAHGLVRSSFVPDTATQELRGLLRTRKQLVREKTSHVQRIQKTLEDANIKIASAISNIMGTTGRAMLEAIVAGNQTRRSSRLWLIRGLQQRLTSSVRLCVDASRSITVFCCGSILAKSTRSTRALRPSTRRWASGSNPFVAPSTS